MSLKEVTDKYLLQYFQTINKARQFSKDFRWIDVAQDIINENGDVFHGVCKNCAVKKEDGEYVRNRFRLIREKLETSSDWRERAMNELEEQGKKLFEENKSKKSDYLTISQDVKFAYQTGKESKEKGTKEWTFTASNIPDESEIIEHFNIDTKKWKIVNIYHKTSFGGKYSITVQTNLLKGVDTLIVDEDFINKINSINPLELKGHPVNTVIKPKASLLIPKQDAHWNKRDIDGKNSIEDRFATFTKTLLGQLEKVIKTNTIEKITYLIGSDEFNSEWTQATTYGTPQSNILTYQQSFEKISEFNIETIKLLKFYAAKVEVVLLNGNHDHNVGWHLATLLKQVFKKNEGIVVNDSIDNTKVIPFHSTLVMLNHGDAIKPKDLAAKFPIVAKDIWSNYQNYTVICGDKHHEVAHDFHGTMFYQVPQLSTAKSDWDDKKGFITSKAELMLFLFEEDGLSNILRKQIK